jgi:general secretion pathway protein G
MFVIFNATYRANGSASSNARIGNHYDANNTGEALNTFEVTNGRFPTTAEGLQALVQKPAGADLPNWRQVLTKVPLDPWGHPYHYKLLSGGAKDFDLRSDGPDGKPNTADDISN